MNRCPFPLFAFALPALLALTGCIGAPVQPDEARNWSTPTPEPAVQTATAATLATQTADARAAIALQAAIAQVTLQASTAIAAEATAQANRQTQQALQLTRDAAATADARAVQATAVALDERHTATAIAVQILQANLAATQSAATSTVQAAQTQSAFAALATQSAFYAQSTLETSRISAIATARAAYNQRTEMTNTFIAWMQALAPILALIAFAVIVYCLAWIWFRVNKARVLHANPQGAYPLVYDDGRLLNAQRAFGPVVDPANPAMPQDETLQGRIAVTDTQVGAVRAMSAGNGNPDQVTRRVQNVMGSSQQAADIPQPFRIVPAERARQALPTEISSVIEAQWKESTHGNNQPE